MNRRELLSFLSAAFALTDLRRFPEPSVPANVSQPDPIRRQFLEARSKGKRFSAWRPTSWTRHSLRQEANGAARFAAKVGMLLNVAGVAER